MRALVTGGTGFIGGHLVDALLQAGKTVTVLVRSPRKAEGFTDRGIRMVEGDLSDPEVLRRAARDQDVIYHCAGLVAARSLGEFFRVNRDGTARLLAAAEASGPPLPRFIFISSLSAAGPAQRGERRRDDEPPAPVSGYGRSKLAGEEVVRAGRLPWTIVRPPAVYGPRDTEFLRAFKAVRFSFLPVFGDGSQELSLVHAEDLARALVAIGGCPAGIGGVYYPCHREVVTTAQLAHALADAMGRRIRLLRLPRWLTRGAFGVTATAARLGGASTLLTPDKTNELFAPAWTADPAPLERVTGWRAEWNIERGTRAVAEWYRRAGWL